MGNISSTLILFFFRWGSLARFSITIFWLLLRKRGHWWIRKWICTVWNIQTWRQPYQFYVWYFTVSLTRDWCWLGHSCLFRNTVPEVNDSKKNPMSYTQLQHSETRVTYCKRKEINQISEKSDSDEVFWNEI